MIALVCDTPYQIVSALFAAKHISPDEKVVLFLNQFWDGTTRRFDVSTAGSYIEDIVYYGKEHMGPLLLFSSLKKPEKMLRRLHGFSFEWDFSCIITSRTAWMATYIYNWNIKKNPALKLYCIEEGIGEYTASLPETRFTKACHALRQTCQTDVIEKAFFSAPTLYPYKTYFPVEKLPVPNNLSTLCPLITEIFGEQDKINEIDQYKYIFLNEAPSAGEDKNAYLSRELSLLELVAGHTGISDMLVKMHPRTDDYDASGIKTLYTKGPMEILPFFLDINKKTLISSMSTGLFTPKLLFDKEPALIVLYKLFMDIYDHFISDAAVRGRYYEFIEGALCMYNDKSKVFAPKNMDELSEYLKNNAL